MKLQFPPRLLLCELHSGPEKVHFFYLYWEALPLRESGCSASSLHSTANTGPRPRNLHRKEVTERRQDSNNLIPEKAGHLSEAEMGAAYRFHIFSAYSTYDV